MVALHLHVNKGAANSCLRSYITSKADEQPTAKPDVNGRGLNYQPRRHITLPVYALSLRQK